MTKSNTKYVDKIDDDGKNEDNNDNQANDE